MMVDDCRRGGGGGLLAIEAAPVAVDGIVRDEERQHNQKLETGHTALGRVIPAAETPALRFALQHNARV
jgi:hypothetical protein